MDFSKIFSRVSFLFLQAFLGSFTISKYLLRWCSWRNDYRRRKWTQIQNETICVSHSTYTLEKRHESICFSLKQTGLFNLDMIIGLKEGKIQTSCVTPKNWSFVASCLWRRCWVNELSVRHWSGRLGFNLRSSHTKD